MTVRKSSARYHVVEGSIAPQRERSLNAGLDIFIQETKILQPGETHYLEQV